MGHARGLPCSQTCLLPEHLLSMLPLLGRLTPEIAASERLQGGPVTSFLHGYLMSLNFSPEKNPLEIENRKLDFFFSPEVFLHPTFPTTAFSCGPHPTSWSESASSASLFQSTLHPSSDECPSRPCQHRAAGLSTICLHANTPPADPPTHLLCHLPATACPDAALCSCFLDSHGSMLNEREWIIF